MPVVYNATNETQGTKAAGNWFTFKPGAMKQMDPYIAQFIGAERADLGLVVLPEEFEDPSYMNSEEGKSKLEEFKAMGIRNYTKHLRALIYNNQVSMRLDLEKANLKIDPAVLASDGEINAMKLLAEYQAKDDDTAQKKIDEVKRLMAGIKPAE